MTGVSPRRGQVWTDRNGYEYLVISIDTFNRSRMRSVIAPGVYPGDQTGDGASPYSTVVEVEDDTRTIFFDDLSVVEKDDLVGPVWEVEASVLADFGNDLAQILGGTPATWPGKRPPRYPKTREIRFADLRIEGGGAKPVVVISCDLYARWWVTHSWWLVG